MKRNAIIRIILWSAVLVILSSVLVCFCVAGNHRNGTFLREGSDFSEIKLATVIQDTVLHKTPSEDSDALTVLSPGAVLSITRQENIGGQEWCYDRSLEGWVPADHIRYQTNAHKEHAPVVQETVVSGTPEVGEKQAFDPQSIREIEIEWVAGKIRIQSDDVKIITVQEDGSFDAKYAMQVRQDEDELKIQFCEEQVGTYFGIHTRSDVEKDLIITVPWNWTCQQLDIDCAAASLDVTEVTIQEVSFDGASGACKFEDCNIGSLDIDTASGDVRIVGTLQSLDCDAASANIYAVLSNVPKRLDLDTMSGDLELTLPRDAGYTLSLDTVSGSFSSRFKTDKINGNYVAGNGACRINFNALSGDITILDE